MKKFRCLMVCLLGLTGVAHVKADTSTVTTRLDAGILENSLGTTVVANGMLVEVLASPSGTFSAPTSSSYITGDNVLITSFAMNSNSGTAGELFAAPTFSLSTANYTLKSGEAILLRFYPDLSFTSAPTTPTLGTTYGQVRSPNTEFTNDSSETAWVVPAAGTTADINYLTANDGGTYANNTAYATNVVLAADVPEPSSIVIQGGVAVGLLGWAVLRCRRA